MRMVSRQHRADRRRRAHRALLDRVRAPSSRWKMRSRSRARSRGIGRSPRALGLSSRALDGALRLQNAARNSMEWFEHVRRYIHLAPEQFAYSLLTRSQRVSHENLRLRDATYRRRRGTLVRECGWHAVRGPSARPRRGRQWRDRRWTAEAPTAADVHAVPSPRHDASQSRRRLADGHVQRDATALRTISISSTSARAHSAAPRSS